MWALVEVNLDRSEFQKPQRTSPLVNVPRYPKKMRIDWNGTKEMDFISDSDDVVMASVLFLSVWNSDDISSGQSTVDNIANPVPSISETTAAV